MPYSSVAHHRAMVFDHHRNELYRRAIEKLVRPGMVVMDLGAGLGVHGLLAARAGAARVYLVEPEPVVHLAAEVARTCGLASRVITLQGRIEDVTLPEKVDLIVSVLAGNLLFSEDLLPALFHARDRHLSSGGLLVPGRAQLWVAPLHAPHLHGKYVARWSQPVLGLDYSAARAFASNEMMALPRDELAGVQRLSPGAVLADLDFSRAASADCNGEAACEVEQGGECHGVLGWIRLELEGEWLTSEPGSPEVHWSAVVLPLDPPLPVAAGETLNISLVRPALGDWTWSVSARGGKRRHSTFLAKPDSPHDLARLAPNARVSLGSSGIRAARALELLQQGLSPAEVATELAQTWQLPHAQLLHEVQRLARRYGQP